MAQLKDLIVTGASRLIGNVYAGTIQITTLNAPTAAGGTTYGPGTNGYVLKSNGSSVYWGSDTDTNTTYTFANGSTGNFTVTPSGGSTQTVSIGKPATAGTADQISALTTTDKASSTATQRRVWFSYDNNSTGRPAYDDTFTYQTSTGTLTAKILNPSTSIKVPTQSAAYTNGIRFINGATEKASIGTDSNGILGLYSTNKIVLRPEMNAATKGLEITATSVHPATAITLGTSSNKWSTVYATTFDGNATTATKLATARSINGTNFDGSADITTANWGTTRSITIGSTSKNVNGSANVSWSHNEIGASVSNTWANGTTAGPTLSTTVNGVTGIAVAVPSANETQSGIVTTGAQNFSGRKGFNLVNYYAKDDSGASTPYPGNIRLYNFAGNQVGQYWYNCGDATNVTDGRFIWREYSPNSTNNTSTTGFYEDYRLPNVDTGRTENVTYEILTEKNYSTILDDRYVNITGDTMTDTLGFNLNADTAIIKTKYNDIDYNVIRNHNNGNISISASGLGLYMGYENTSFINWKNDGMYLSGTNRLGLGTTDPAQKLHINTGLLAITNNNNTVTIGSANSSWCHIQNTANIPFFFNNGIGVAKGSTIGFAASDKMQYRPFQLYLGYNTTSDSRALDSNNPLIEFANSSRSQYAQIVYTDYNNQGGSDSFTFVSNQSDLRVYAPKVYGAVWNDYAEYRETKEKIEPGRCVHEMGDDSLELTTERLQKGCEIVSDTFGFAIGESETAKTPTAASGRVLAYLYEDREIARQHIGDPVCSGPNGTVSIMTEEEEIRYHSRIIGTISAVPDYDIWHAGADGKLEIKVDGRIWIRIR